jgi:hypothetical protein
MSVRFGLSRGGIIISVRFSLLKDGIITFVRFSLSRGGIIMSVRFSLSRDGIIISCRQLFKFFRCIQQLKVVDLLTTNFTHIQTFKDYNSNNRAVLAQLKP